ncbi:hypothetical protein BYT27DRAFT_7120458, partial [Phlegmacium glaucopus]
DMDIFADFLILRGKPHDFKLIFQSIARHFLLSKNDQHVLFILGLSTPIRQGQALYQFLVMQFTREEEITAERVSVYEMQREIVNLIYFSEDIAKYDKSKKNYKDPTYEFVSSNVRALAGNKIFGSASFPRFVRL